jgi:hypothetical protein
MDRLDASATSEQIHINGFPDAVKVIELVGPNAKRLADLALHRSDLHFAMKCLETINTVPTDLQIARQALWQIALVRFYKCFGRSKSRFSLSEKLILKDEPEGLKVFRYFKSLRDKHLVHDENSYSQSLPCAILNAEDSPQKIAKIVTVNPIPELLVQESYSSLSLLVTRAVSWVEAEFDSLCGMITGELESQGYGELYALNSPTYTVPGANDIHDRR